jgi:N-acyl-D-amino-acid deacylase
MAFLAFVPLAAVIVLVSACVAPSSRGPGTVIINALVVDGTGAPPRRASVRIEGDGIAAIGDLEPEPGDRVVDAGGKVLAPGFVDTHSHGDDEVFDHPEALAAVSQGITTIVGGQDGGAPFPLSEYFTRLDSAPAAVNVACYAGHGTLRRHVMGEDYRREATVEEVSTMKALLGRELQAGALGLAAGLEYDPGIYAAREEMIELAKVASRAGGRYISHLRSEDRYFWDAIDEILTIGREARIPVQISHIKLAMRDLWGQAEKLIATLDQARDAGVEVSADIYPYLYWQSTLTVLFPRRDFDNRVEAERVLAEIAPAEGLLLGRFTPDPSYVGKTVAEIAAIRKTDPARTLMDLIAEAEARRREGDQDVESVIGTSMIEADVERLMAWPHTNFCTDGQFRGRHPRGFGSYPRVLGRYIRERKAMGLEEGIRKMTSLAAEHVGLTARGAIVPGNFADLVLFDPETVIDRATTEDPQAVSAGIERVWVNGEMVYENGAATGKRPGRVLRRAAAGPTSEAGRGSEAAANQ